MGRGGRIPPSYQCTRTDGCLARAGKSQVTIDASGKVSGCLTLRARIQLWSALSEVAGTIWKEVLACTATGALSSTQ